MACNFLGMLSAPDIEQPLVFVATYSSGFGLTRKEISAPTRLAAYATASMRPPEGHTLTNLRKKKSFTAPRRPVVSLEESVDVNLTRALAGVYANTDLACRFVAAEIRYMASGARA